MTTTGRLMIAFNAMRKNFKRGVFFVVLPLLLGVTIYFSEAKGILRNYLPDTLWMFSATSAFVFIWGKIHKCWLLVLFVCSSCYEMLQSRNVVKGTGDIKDILAYFIGMTLSIFIIKYYEKK